MSKTDIISLSLNFDKNFNKNKNYRFTFPFNNETTFGNLFEMISILFPNQKLCACFKYEIEKIMRNIYQSIKIKQYIN